MKKIPVVLLCFQRYDVLEKIIDVLRSYCPDKVYVCSDYGRNAKEISNVLLVRETIDRCIDWPCEVFKYYADENIGVYSNIALNAKKIFGLEEMAIFLEDDNLPSISFFDYCEKMLLKYKDNDQILWINGTNYLGDSSSLFGDFDYAFHNQMLPCGWASWSRKFLMYYEFNFDSINNKHIKIAKPASYRTALFFQQREMIFEEVSKRDNECNYRSWDYHILWSIWKNDLLGIIPSKNLITNVGDDDISIHNCKKKSNKVMTKRYCNVPSFELPAELRGPNAIEINKKVNKSIQKIMTPPFTIRIKSYLVKVAKFLRLK